MGGGWLFGRLLYVLICAAVCLGKDLRVGSETIFDGGVQDVEWFGKDKKVLIARTLLGHVYRSEDAGETWAKITEKIANGVTKNGPFGVRLGRLQRNELDPNRAVLTCIMGPCSAFSTEDAGRTWFPWNFEYQLNSWMSHRTRPTWALASAWVGKCAVFLAERGECSHNLYLTKDAGRTFELVATHIVQFAWASVGDRILFSQWRKKETHQNRLTSWSKGVDLMATDDMGKTVITVLAEGNKFQLSNGYLLAVVCKDQGAQDIQLSVSKDDGRSFKNCVVPETLKQRSYAVLDTSEGAVVLHVNHRSSQSGDIYISDSDGVEYARSLVSNVRKQGLCAFEKVYNLEGVYIANAVDEGKGPLPSLPEEEEESVPFEGAAGQTQAEFAIARSLNAVEVGEEKEEENMTFDHPVEGLAMLDQHEQVREARVRGGSRWRSLIPEHIKEAVQSRRLAAMKDVRTVVSFDMGGAWSTIRAPRVDSAGNEIQCSTKKCSLHLHSIADLFDFGPVYSYKNSAGILMGTGNVGEELSFDKSQTNTYVSRDGGHTWSEVQKGNFIYEYGNHGGLLVMSDLERATSEGVYSWDQGKTWSKFQFSTNPMRVSNVLIEAEAMSTKFVIYGTRNNDGVMHLLDFGLLHERQCKGLDTVGKAASDYEHWSPSDGIDNHRCMLGHKNVYTRRKQLAECFNSEEEELPKFSRNCHCTPESFECEVGFVREVNSLQCDEDPESTIRHTPPPNCNGEYKVNAYRRVPGDTCQGGWAPEPVTKVCKTSLRATAPSASSSGPTFLGFVVGISSVGACILVTKARSARAGGYAATKPQPGPRAPTEMVGAGAGGYVAPSAAGEDDAAS